MSFWNIAYETNNVPWDPGPFDGHLPGVLDRHRVGPCRVVDLGCGAGGSLVMLSRRGFACTGIDSAPAALRIAAEKAREQGASCTWLVGSFPEDFPKSKLPDGCFDLAIDRGWFHLFTGRAERERVLAGIARILAPGGLWYSLVAAPGGKRGFVGPPRWKEPELRRALEDRFEILELEKSVFTPGESGSMPAWICVMRRP